MGVWIGWIGIYGRIGFFEDDLEMGTFLRKVILVGVAVRDLTIRSGAMECCFEDGEDGAGEEGAIFLLE